MKTSALLICTALALGPLALGQPAAPTPKMPALPSGPLLDRAPEFSQWSIAFNTVTAPDSNASKATDATAPKPVKRPTKTMTVTKTKEIVFEQSTDEAGQTVETWHTGGATLFKGGGSGSWSVSAAGSGDPFDAPDYSKSDFAGFDWISPENYTGQHEMNGKKCLVFASRALTLSQRDMEVLKESIGRQITAEMLDGKNTEKGSKLTDGSGSLATPTTKRFDPNDYLVPVEAYVDLATRLPVLLKYGDKSRTYQFHDIPHTEQVLPAEAQQASASYLKYVSRLSRNAARP